MRIISGFMRHSKYFIRINEDILFDDSNKVISKTMFFKDWRMRKSMKIMDRVRS